MDEQSTPIAQLNPNIDDSGDSLSANILRDLQQESIPEMPHQPHWETPVPTGYEPEGQEDEEYDEEQFQEMYPDTSDVKIYLVKQALVIIIGFFILQIPQLIDMTQKFLTQNLSKFSLSGRTITYLDIFVRGLILALFFFLVQEFLL